MHKLRVIFIARVTSHLLHTSYELLFIPRFTSNFYYTNYALQFIRRVTSYFLTMSYNKDKDDKAVYDNKVMIKNYFWDHFLIKNLEFAKPRFRVINIY